MSPHSVEAFKGRSEEHQSKKNVTKVHTDEEMRYQTFKIASERRIALSKNRLAHGANPIKTKGGTASRQGHPECGDSLSSTGGTASRLSGSSVGIHGSL